MMMAIDATNSMLDHSLAQLKTSPPDARRRVSVADKWPMRRWSLRGTADTRSQQHPQLRHSLTTAAPPASSLTTEKPTRETDNEKRKRSRSIDISPLQSSLKKAPATITTKLAQCVESLGLRDALHRYKSTSNDNDDHVFPHHVHHDQRDRHVHFPTSLPHFKQVYERPETSEEEKSAYHYSRQELLDMVVDAKESLARETRFSSQPDNTIFEQGYLTLPNELHLFHHKRYYCLLKARELLCYANPIHASKQTHLKCKIPILKVQECSSMSNQAKIAAFGAHLPPTLSLMFFVTRADGERVLLAAESRAIKKSWVHTLQRLTQVQEALPVCVMRQTSTSSASKCASEDESDHSLCGSDDDEEKHETPETKEKEDEHAQVACA